MYAFLRGFMRVITRVVLFGGLLEIQGLENVPREGPLLVCSNHISTVDPPLLPAELPRADSWSMAKSEYFAPDSHVTRVLFTWYHAFPVVRHSADRAAIRRAFGILESGQALIVYPEGTRVDEAQLREPEPGVGLLAQRSQAPVLPVALTGSNEVFPKGAILPRRRRLRVVFGRPFRLPTERADGSRVTRQEAADAIMAAIAEMLPPENRGVFAQLEERRLKAEALYLPVTTGSASSSPLR